MNKHRWRKISDGCVKCGKSFHSLHWQLFKKSNDKKYDVGATRTPKGWMMIRRKINEEVPCEISDRQYERDKVVREVIE